MAAIEAMETTSDWFEITIRTKSGANKYRITKEQVFTFYTAATGSGETKKRRASDLIRNALAASMGEGVIAADRFLVEFDPADGTILNVTIGTVPAP